MGSRDLCDELCALAPLAVDVLRQILETPMDERIPRGCSERRKTAEAVLNRAGYGPHSTMDVDANLRRPLEGKSTEELLELVRAARGGSSDE